MIEAFNDQSDTLPNKFNITCYLYYTKMDPLKIEGRPLNTHKDVRFFNYSSYIASCGKNPRIIKFINLLFSFLDWHLILLAQPPPPPPSPTYKPTKIQIHPSITVDQFSS